MGFTKSPNNESKYSLNQYSLFLPSVPLGLSGYRTICMVLNVTSALTHFPDGSEHLPLDDRRVMIFLDVFLMLSIILDSLLLREVWREGFIENDITDILLIGQYGFDGSLRPGSFSSGSQNAVSFQILLDAAHTISVQVQLEYLTYYLCLRLVDYQAAIFGIAVSVAFSVIYLCIWVLGSLIQTPLDILTLVLRLALGNGSMKADCKFRFLVKGIHLLILKVDRDIHLFQFPNNSQNIHRVSGKSADGY